MRYITGLCFAVRLGGRWAEFRRAQFAGADRHNPAHWPINGWQLVAGESAMSVLCLTARRLVDTAPLHPVGRA